MVKQMQEVNYKQGMTKVWSDGDKITVKTKGNKKHVLQNVEQIFGEGQWDRILDVAYSITDEKFNYAVVSPYIPQRVLDDLGIDNDDKGLIDRYFK